MRTAKEYLLDFENRYQLRHSSFINSIIMFFAGGDDYYKKALREIKNLTIEDALSKDLSSVSRDAFRSVCSVKAKLEAVEKESE